ncbi:MAG: carbohydrate ABC transporter permease [Hamadaea sp.]|uniref:carbohydrate ABC transporter permease n=1 Tax=Hamadaea sp. TaxID=2024425 RepID=UPI0017D727C8|nr:carbohydrate ABC transporter permease [Hamadaea sp.]NUT22617.1 carbohydrate ABC transporter permease [Hamadaea sp.]
MTTTTLPRNRRTSNRPPWEEKPTALGQGAKTLIITIVLAVIAVPIYSVVLTSFSTQASINRAGGLVMIPDELTTQAYKEIFSNQLIVHSLLVSLTITVLGTALSMVVSVLAAYGLSRSRSFAHRPILMFMIVTMFFGGGLVPTFLVVAGLGGYDNYWSQILPGAVAVFNILVLRSFFSSTSPELIDAAKIDGAGDWRILWSIVLPTSKAVLAVITLFYAVGYWNNFFAAQLYLPDNGMWPLPQVVNTYVLQGNSMPGSGITNTGQYFGHQQVSPLTIQMAVVTLTLLPILIVYPFVQKHFTKGVMIGAVKG